MVNFQVVAFGIIMAVVGVGVDYHQQSLKSGRALGELGPGDYLQTITARYADVQQAREDKATDRARAKLRRAGARPYLPDAPDGWTRREWLAGDNSRITRPAREMQDFEKEAIEDNPTLKNMLALSEESAAEARNEQSWVYERGDEIVSVRVRFTELPKGNTISANAMTMVIGNMNAMTVIEGWGVIQGVAYGAYGSFDPDAHKDFLTLTAAIGFGSEVKLDVRTNTTDAATREILTRIDYDGLNALLPRPLAHVGSTARDIPLAQQAEMASRMIEIREDLINQRTAAAENWLRAATTPEDAMTLALREVGIGISGTMGDADAALSDVLQEVGTLGTANPDDQAGLDEPGDQPVQTASTAQAGGGKISLASKPLSQDRIKKLEAMSAAERSMALTGLSVGVRKFEEKNGLPDGSCAFSMDSYRVECGEARQEAKAGTFSSILSSFMNGGDTEEPAAPATPTRLKLSGGKSCLDNALGSFCKN